jgi:hypothetical protein
VDKASSQEPKLNPMPGRVIVRIIDRIKKIPGTDMLVSNDYQYQPYIGYVLAVGDPLNETQEKLCAELIKRSEAGERAIFTWGSGTAYDSEQMEKTPHRREDGSYYTPFDWLVAVRTFRIEDFANTVIGGDSLGGFDPKSAEVPNVE